MKNSKVTVNTLRDKKLTGERIAMLTAYDATFAQLLDSAGVDILLVGDSLGMVFQGHASTLPVTLEDIIYHTRAVTRRATRSQVVADMPFMSYQVSVEDGMRSAGRLMKEAGAEAVKLEGGADHAELIRRLTRSGIPVMGHLGLTPQSVHQLGGFRLQGRGQAAAEQLIADAKALAEAGCYALVLEMIPATLASKVTKSIAIPTIGIGAGVSCDGQVLVINDLLGMNESFHPRFVKRYDNLGARIRSAVEDYVREVRAGVFPAPEHSFSDNSESKPNASQTS